MGFATDIAAGATVGSAIPGIGTAAGAIGGGLLGLADWGLGQFGAKQQMDFQERMSSTAYQRAVEDMKKAGLNPLMMYGGHGGMESTPSGASAGTGNLSQSVTSAARFAAVDKPVAESQVAVNEAVAGEKDAAALLDNEQTNKVYADKQLSQQSYRWNEILNAAQLKLTQANIDVAQSQADRNTSEARKARFETGPSMRLGALGEFNLKGYEELGAGDAVGRGERGTVFGGHSSASGLHLTGW